MGVLVTVVTGAHWRAVGAAVRGSGHQASGLPCQDAFSVTPTPDGGLVIAVADGAGTRERAEVGAAVAVGAVGRWAAAGTDLELTRGFAAARVALRSRAAADERDVSEYACTLTVAHLADGMWSVGQIGDGIVVAEGPVSLYSALEREYVNQTDFVTTIGSAPELASAPAGPLAVMTDGLRMKVLANLQTGEPFAGFFEDVWSWAAAPDADEASLAQFLDGLDDQTGDDKTLVLVVPVG